MFQYLTAEIKFDSRPQGAKKFADIFNMKQSAARVLPMPSFENLRVRKLRSLGLLDTGPDVIFDELLRVATVIADTPMGAISLIDRDRQWFKSRVGLGVDETARDVSFCTHTILQPTEPLIIADATVSDLFHDNALVTGDPHIRFYAGFPITLPYDGFTIGSLCVVDTKPRELSERQIALLCEVARSLTKAVQIRCSQP